MVANLVIVPRWGADQDMEWYPWLRALPEVTGRFGQILGPDIEDRGTPTIAAWVASLTAACPRDALASTWLLGHSVGCQAILHYLASLPDGAAVAGVLAVAGWWTVDEPWDSIRPWLYTDEAPTFDVARARRACPRLHVLISDNDPFTADWRTTEAHWRERMGAEVQVVPGAKHFNATEAPVVRDTLAALVSG